MKKLNYFARFDDKDPLETITDKKVQARIIKTVKRIRRYVNFFCMVLEYFQTEMRLKKDQNSQKYDFRYSQKNLSICGSHPSFLRISLFTKFVLNS